METNGHPPASQPVQPGRSDDTVLRLPQVLAVVGLSRSSVYQMMANGQFPHPIRLSSRSVGWRSSAVQGWLSSREGAGSVQ